MKLPDLVKKKNIEIKTNRSVDYNNLNSNKSNFHDATEEQVSHDKLNHEHSNKIHSEDVLEVDFAKRWARPSLFVASPFDGLTKDTFVVWESVLFNNTEILAFSYDDNEFSESEWEDKTFRIILNDCERTRVKERRLVPEFRDNIQRVLVKFCKSNKTAYKQGLNEILAPFLMLKNHLELSLHQVYNLFFAFVSRFCSKFYIEHKLDDLKSYFKLLNVLLKYHEPSLYKLLDDYLIVTEMYSTNWILTMMLR